MSSPEVFAGKTVGQVADHYAEVIGGLEKKPAVIGHSFGGLLTEIVAGRGLSAASVAIDAAPSRRAPAAHLFVAVGQAGVGQPGQPDRAVPLTYDQFRSVRQRSQRGEARELYDTFVVPASGVPLFQAAAANLNPWSEAKVDTQNPDRGPMLMVSGEGQHRPSGHLSGGLQEAAQEPRNHRIRRSPRPGATPSRSTAVGAK